MAEKCEACTEKCPMGEMAHNAALGRMYATNEFVSLLKKVENGELVEVVRCGECVNSREMDKYEKKLYLDGCVGCTRLSSSYNSIIMAPDDFCSYGVRREENAAD